MLSREDEKFRRAQRRQYRQKDERRRKLRAKKKAARQDQISDDWELGALIREELSR